MSKLITVTKTKIVAAAENYAAKDVISESATLGTAWVFDNVVRKNGDSGYIVGGWVFCETAAQAQRLSLDLYNKPPTCQTQDNVGYTGVLLADIDKYTGCRLDFPGFEDVGGTSQAVIVPGSPSMPMPFICAPDSKSLHGMLFTRDAFTNEAATKVYSITLIIELVD